MALAFSKYVVMTNPRLKRLYHLTVLISLFTLVIWFFSAEVYLREVNVSDEVQVELRVLAPQNKEKLAAAWAKAQTKPVCTSPSDYDYKGENLRDTAMNNMCLPPCALNDGIARNGGIVNHKCYSAIHAAIQETPDDVVLVTSMRAEGYNETFLMPIVEEYSIDFTYRYRVPVQSSVSQHTKLGEQLEHLVGDAKNDTLTVILNSKKEIWKEIRPSSKITLTVPQLLELAGEVNALDAPHSYFGVNEIPDAKHPEGPTGRISGLQLDLEVKCYNKRQLEGVVLTWDKVCYIQVTKVDKGVFLPRMTFNTNVESSFVFSQQMGIAYNGIRVRTKVGGQFNFFSWSQVYYFWVTAIVVLGLPKHVLLVIATRGLGQLSRIYRRVIFEKFSIGEQVGGEATRLMSSSASFVQLEERDVQRGITKARLKERIKSFTEYRLKQRRIHAFGEDVDDSTESSESYKGEKLLAEEDLRLLVDFAYKSITEPLWINEWDDEARLVRKLQRIACCRPFIERCIDFWRIFDETAFLNSSDDNGLEVQIKEGMLKAPTRMNENVFVNAHCNAEPIGIGMLMQLFDHTRRKTLLERFFTPTYLNDFMEAHRVMREKISRLPETEQEIQDVIPRKPSVSEGSHAVMSENAGTLETFARKQDDVELILSPVGSPVKTQLPESLATEVALCLEVDEAALAYQEATNANLATGSLMNSSVNFAGNSESIQDSSLLAQKPNLRRNTSMATERKLAADQLARSVLLLEKQSKAILEAHQVVKDKVDHSHQRHDEVMEALQDLQGKVDHSYQRHDEHAEMLAQHEEVQSYGQRLDIEFSTRLREMELALDALRLDVQGEHARQRKIAEEVEQEPSQPKDGKRNPRYNDWQKEIKDEMMTMLDPVKKSLWELQWKMNAHMHELHKMRARAHSPEAALNALGEKQSDMNSNMTMSG